MGKHFKYIKQMSYTSNDITQLLSNLEKKQKITLLPITKYLSSEKIINVKEMYHMMLKEDDIVYVAFLTDKYGNYVLGHVSKIPEEHRDVGYYKSGKQDCVVPTLFVKKDNSYITINGV